MNRSIAAASLAGALAMSACSAGPAGPNTVSGSVQGSAWSNVGAAHWIGMPSPGSPPVILFLTESRLDCAAISVVNWDKIIGESRVLEIQLRESAVREFGIPLDANVAYLKGFYNPDADAGSVTIKEINPAASMIGTYEAKYGTDTLRGAFEARYCATGVEP